MNKKILCVDDDKNLLEGYKRNLKNLFKIETAENGSQGIEKVIKNGPFSVIVSDLKMPEMDGIKFFSIVKDYAPDTVRILLTGYADLENAIKSVNEGNIFRFLTKPCPPDLLKKIINSGIEQYRLITSEKILLEKTLRGIIKILSDVLSLTNPLAFSKAMRVASLSVKIAKNLKLKNTWQIEISALLSQIGCIAIPEDILTKAYGSDYDKLLNEEKEMFDEYPQIGADLISSIPRLEKIAEIIYLQRKNIDGTGFPFNYKQQIPIGAKILKIVNDYDSLTSSDIDELSAIDIINSKIGIYYDENIYNTLEEIIKISKKQQNFVLVKLNELKPDMVLLNDLITKDGTVLLPKNHRLSEITLKRIINYNKNTIIKEPIKVEI